MDINVKEKWLAALRSGKYKQCKGHLRVGNKFCCLGVLCDIYHEETKDGEWVGNADGITEFKDGSYGGLAILTNNVTKWAGLQDNNPYLEEGNNCGGANDAGKTFKEIADLIEKYL